MKRPQSHRHQTTTQNEPLLPWVAAQLPLNITGIPADLLIAEEVEIIKILDAMPLEGPIANMYSAEGIYQRIFATGWIGTKAAEYPPVGLSELISDQLFR